MALPNDLEDAMRHVLRRLNNLSASLLPALTRFGAQNAVIGELNGLLNTLVEHRNDIADLKGRPGALAFARNIYGNQSLDIITLLSTVQSSVETAVVALRSAMTSIADGSGWVGAYRLSAIADDPVQILWRDFTPAQTATLRANLASIRTAIADLRTARTGG